MSAGEATWVLLAKAPQRGRVKSRLAQDVGADAAAEVQEAMLLDLLALRPRRMQRVLALDGASKALTDHARSLGWDVEPQPAGDLGQRMAFFLQRSEYHGPVVLTGSDAPLLDASVLEEAGRQARRGRLVMAPALDGGFVLLAGQRDGVEGGWSTLLHDHTWSHPQAMAQVVARAARLQLGLHLLPAEMDVDTLQDLPRLEQRLRDKAPGSAPRTAAWLDESRPLWQV